MAKKKKNRVTLRPAQDGSAVCRVVGVRKVACAKVACEKVACEKVARVQRLRVQRSRVLRLRSCAKVACANIACAKAACAKVACAKVARAKVSCAYIACARAACKGRVCSHATHDRGSTARRRRGISHGRERGTNAGMAIFPKQAEKGTGHHTDKRLSYKRLRQDATPWTTSNLFLKKRGGVA